MEKFNVYFAGGLFDHKELAGNLHLALAIEKVAPQYHIVLPQNSASNAARAIGEIRDRDFEMLFGADCLLANFDGTELDSGSVVEFCIAKMLDLPTVLLRTDFRDKCDNGSDPWNLMCSNYPRTKNCLVNAMLLFCGVKDLSAVADREETIARQVADALDEMRAVPPRLTREHAFSVYRDTRDAIGNLMPEIFPDERLRELVSAKTGHGIYAEK